MSELSVLEQNLRAKLRNAEQEVKEKAAALVSAHKAWAIACVACLVGGFILGKVL